LRSVSFSSNPGLLFVHASDSEAPPPRHGLIRGLSPFLLFNPKSKIKNAAVSYTYSYFIPLSPEPDPAEYALRAKEFLMAQTIICEGDRPGYFGLGDNALLPFEQRDDWDAGFDFGDIFGGPHLTIVPVDDQPLEPKCPKCRANVGPELNRLYCPDETTSV